MTSSHHPERDGAFPSMLSRRRLFELGGASIGLAALLAACGDDTEPAAGQIGVAPEPTPLPSVEVNDAVLLRTATSLEHAIVEVYAALSALDGLSETTQAALATFTDNHTANASTLAGLTTDVGGTPYECANPWMMHRHFQPVLDNVIGRPADGEAEEIPPTDDADRDTLAISNAIETLASSTYQGLVEKLSTPSLRATVIPLGSQAARHAATIAIVAGGDEPRYVAPELLGAEPAEEGEFAVAYAISSRFGQLVPIEMVVGAQNDLGLRFTGTFETPADNAYRYGDEACGADDTSGSSAPPESSAPAESGPATTAGG